MAAPTPRNATFSNSGGATTSVTIAMPSDVADGETVIMAVLQESAGTLSTNVAWTLLNSAVAGSTAITMAVWARVWSTGDPMSYAVTSTVSERFAGGTIPFSGASGIDVHNVTPQATSGPYVCPTVTTTQADTYVLRMGMERGDVATHSAAGQTALGQAGLFSAGHLSVWGLAQASAGATGTVSITSSIGTRSGGGFTVAILGAASENPSTLTATMTGQDAALSWAAPDVSTVDYDEVRIFRRGPGGLTGTFDPTGADSGLYVATVPIGTTTYDDTGLAAGDYEWQVFPVDTGA